ncbi:MAG: biopolymer transporter ExbD [Planctomycetota bacterium]|nr:biopolymer transporter ExbD [Planctomycetota bacterium]
MPKRKKADLPRTELNITSMMDLVLNLLMFFVLTSNFALAELPKVEIPELGAGSQARANEKPDKIVVSVVAEGDSGNAVQIKVGSSNEVAPGDYGRLTQLLLVEKTRSKDVAIDLRADKRLHYESVAPIMKAITEAGISHVNIVAGLPDSE